MRYCLLTLLAVQIIACSDVPVRPPIGEHVHAYAITTDSFGMLNGQTVHAFTLRNAAGMSVSILDYGGIVTRLVVPDRSGAPGDVVLGYNSLEGYLPHDNFPYFGCIAGRYANRIARARFIIDGVKYQIAANNLGNALHGGIAGFDKRIWNASTKMTDDGAMLMLQYTSPDGEEGYPGNLQVEVIYTLTADNALRIDYRAQTDSATPVNLTQHSYFNLSAGREPDVLRHTLTLDADHYTPVTAKLIPTGDLTPVSGTAFDFTQPKPVGQDIRRVPGGYDHNFEVRDWKPDGVLRPVATLTDTVSGRQLKMYSTEPGVQFYSGNFLDGTRTGKEGAVYERHAGLCLEAQHFPDSPNQNNFPNTILRPGETYRQTTIYQFSTIP